MSSVVRAREMARGLSQRGTIAPLPLMGRGVGEGCEVAVWLDMQRDTLTLPSPFKGEDWCGVNWSLVEGYTI
jgi:hypothetical protein